MIRTATTDDIEQMLLIVAQVHQEIEYYRSFELNIDRAADMLLTLAITDEGIVLVSENDEQIEGFVFGIITEFWFTNTKYATDMALCVGNDFRNKTVGYKLLKQFIKTAKEKGAEIISTSLNDEADNAKYERLITRLGYQYQGRNFEMDLRK